MNKALNPVALAGIIAVVVVVLVLIGWHMLQPAPYMPSPGVVSGPRPGDPASRSALTGSSSAGSRSGSASAPGSK